MTVAINKNFIVKNGIEVADNLIYTDTINSNVGLGTSVPEASLHVAGNVFVGDGIKVIGVTTTTTKLDVGVGGTVLTVDSTLGDENGKGSVRVGINTQDPTRTLHVIGDTGTHHPGIPGHPGVGYTALYVEGYTHINGLAEFNDKLASSWQIINDDAPYYGLWQDNDVGRLILKGTDANLDNKAINVYRNGSLQGNRVFNVGYDGSVGIASTFTGDGELKIDYDSTNHQKGFRVYDNSGTTLMYVSGTGNNATAVGVYSGDGSGGGTYMVNIKHDGSATFAGTIQSGGNPNAGIARGTSINEYGTVRACQTSGSSTIWEGYTKDTGTTTSSITAAGAATFVGDLTINTDALFVDASAKSVGIGTASPASTLHLQASSAGTIQTFTAPGNQPNKIQFQKSNGTLDAEIKNELTSLIFSTGSTPTPRMTIESDGDISMPGKPAFRCYMSTERTTNGDFTTGWNSTQNGFYSWDTNDDFDHTTGLFTAPSSGKYHFIVQWDAYGVQSQIDMLINSTFAIRYEPTGNSDDSWETHGWSTTVAMGEGDTAKLNGRGASGTHPFHMGNGYWGYWCGFKIN